MRQSWEGKLESLLAELVGTPSVNPAFWQWYGEARVGRIVARELEEIGAQFSVHSYPDPTALEGTRPNYVALIPGQSKDRRLVIATHMDTVGTNEEDWTITKPFEPRVVGGRLYGLGSADNKGPLAASLVAASLVDKPAQDVLLVYTSDEEFLNHHGIYRLMEEGVFDPSRDVAYVPDCGADGTLVQNSEKSNLWLKLSFDSGMGHHEALRRLSRLRESLMARYPETEEFVEGGRSTFEPTAILGTPWTDTNTIPGNLETEWMIAGGSRRRAARLARDAVARKDYGGVDVGVYRVPGGFRVSYSGRSAHASIPDRAASAVLAAAEAEPLVYGAVGSVASGGGRIVGAEDPLRMEMDCRLLSRHEPRDVLDYAKSCAGRGMEVDSYAKENWTHAPVSPADDPLALAIISETERICDRRPEMYQVAGWSVATPLRRMGIPAYGGGIISDVPGHGPDEYVDLLRLVGETILMKHLMETKL